ncbi:MAG: hypothetical protein KOO63_00990 [Bacteroidales bacterium]|nr:hypothetical protein [Candidatus Latescibacterota bacterium]
MPFPYYDNLSAANKRIYRKSDAIESIHIKNPSDIHPATIRLKRSLEGNRRRDVARHASEICRLVCEDLAIERLIVKISTRRPSNEAEELHGLYEWTEGETPLLTVWMKTAVQGQVVAFKSFIRTVLHELCHHIDFAHFDLEDSFHTEGFFKRESSLYRQIVPTELQKKQPRKKRSPLRRPQKKEKDKNQKSRKPEQIDLF